MLCRPGLALQFWHELHSMCVCNKATCRALSLQEQQKVLCLCVAALPRRNKVAAGAAGTPQGSLPPAYLQALSEATDVVLVQPCDNW